MKSLTRWLTLSLFVLAVSGYSGTTIPVEINDGGYIFIDVKINGNINARFMVDTGAGVNVISEQLYEKLRPTLKEAGLHTGTRHNGEQITGMLYSVPELSLGNYVQQDVIVGVYDALRDFDGLLSLDYFRELPFTIDFINHRLTIEDKSNLDEIRKNSTSIPIAIKRNGKHEISFFVDLCLNGNVKCKAEFDSGAGFNMLMLHPRYIETLKLKIPSESVNYGYYLFSTTLPSLTYCTDKETLVSKNVFVGFKEGLIYEGLVGTGMFSTRRLTINIPGSEMLVELRK